MATLKLDKAIVDFIKKIKATRKFGDGTIAGVLARAVRFFRDKHNECFTCQHHKNNLAELELGRQAIVKASLESGQNKEPDVSWVSIPQEDYDTATEISLSYKRTVKNVIEQAALEHITRPPACSQCPFYKEMCGRIRSNRGSARARPASTPIVKPNQETVEAE